MAADIETLRARLEASTKWLIGERDSLYDCISDADGKVPDGDDKDYLRGLDAIIDENRRVLGYQDAPRRQREDRPLDAAALAAKGFPAPGLNS